jgi:Tol biopolymer transport system component
MQLTSLSVSPPRGPRWSWDGQSIAFWAAAEGGEPQVYTIGANGGVAQRMTTVSGGGKWPYWSRDGRWLYFVSPRDGGQVWKMPATGGQATQITRNGGDVPQESPDGKFIYYH